MGLFENALKKIGEAVTDLSSLDVTTYKGSVVIKSNSKVESFDTVFSAAKANQKSSLKVLASTRVSLDGDIAVFYDEEIEETEKQAHNELVMEATENRRDTINMIRDIVGDSAKNL